VSRHPRLTHAIVDGDRLEVVPAPAVLTRTKLYTEEHAREYLAALTKDTVAVVVRELGPGMEVA
jgi:hypothetical protein